MTIAGLLASLALPLSLAAQDLTAPQLPAPQTAHEFQLAPGLAEPLWISLAGRKVQGQRAHVLVEFESTAANIAAHGAANPATNPATNPAAKPRPSLPGLTLLESAGGHRYFATLDLASPLGIELQNGNPAVLARTNLRGLRVLDENDKLPPATPAYAYVNAGQTTAEFDLYFFADTHLPQAQTDLALLGVTTESVAEYFHRMRITVTSANDSRALKALAKLDWVQFLTPAPPGKRQFTNRESGTLIQVNTLQGPDFSLTGKDVTLGIVDGDIPSTHREFTGRLTGMEGRSAIAGGAAHATHVAGTIIAAGEFDARLRGMSTGAKLNAWHYAGDEVQKMLSGSGEVIAFNNSWGLLIDVSLGNCNEYGAYGGTERDIDRLIRDRNVALVFASGNDRDLDSCSLLPQAGYYSASRPSTAKNVITVSAARSTGQITEFGGAGPTRDGRVKPDLVALGTGVLSTSGAAGTLTLEGTSMSAPAVTGTIGLLAERYKAKNNGERPPADLMKAVLLNTAKDMGNPGPDYTYGYGLVQAVEAVKTIDDARFARDKVAAGAVKQKEFEVPAGAASLRVLLVYSDLPGAPDARSAIVNHLDVELTGPGGLKVLPLGLDPTKPNASAAPRAGLRDVTKQMVADNPAAGKWTITVRGLEVAEGEQEFALTWTFAANPLPACTATVSSTLALAGEKPEVRLLHVNANNHCDAWQVRNVPDWLRVVGGDQKGTGVVKLAFTENSGDRARDTRIQIAGQDVRVRQNPRCIAPIAIGQSIDAVLGAADCLVEFGGFFGSSYVYLRKYEFSGTQGQRVAISMLAGVGGIDAYLYLVAPGDVVLQEDDDSGGNPRAFDFSARIPFTGGYYVLPYTGPYTIWATTALELESGPYTLKIEEGPPAPGGLLVPKPITACPVQLNGELTVNSSTSGRRGDLFRTDVYQFFARLGQDITVEMPGATFDPFVYLLSPSGTTVGTITNDGSGARKVTVAAPRTGTYSVEVTTFAPFVTGTYSLGVQGCSPQ